MKETFSDQPLDPSGPDHDMLQHIRGMIQEIPLRTMQNQLRSLANKVG
jgi:hypothetical protein